MLKIKPIQSKSFHFFLGFTSMLYLKITKSTKFGDSYQTQSEFYVNPILILEVTLKVKLKISSDNIANHLKPSVTKIQNKNSKRTVFRL